MSQSAKHFFRLTDLFCASFTGTFEFFPSRLGAPLCSGLTTSCLRLDKVQQIQPTYSFWGGTFGVAPGGDGHLWCARNVNWEKVFHPFLLASRGEGWHFFFLVSNSLMYYIKLYVYLSDSSWVFLSWWSLNPFDIVDIPSKFVCCKVWPWRFFKTTKAISHLKSASLAFSCLCFMGSWPWSFYGTLGRGATWWSPKMWLSCKFLAVSVADFGNGTLNLPSTEAWSPLKEDLPHPSWAKTIFNERPGHANYGRNPLIACW